MLSLNCNSNARAIYKNSRKAQDATFEVMDAVLLTRKAQSLADLSLSCVFRRLRPECLRGATRYPALTREINETLHRTN